MGATVDDLQSLKLFLTDDEKIAIRNSGPGMRRLLAYADAMAGRVDALENQAAGLQVALEKVKQNGSGRGPGRPPGKGKKDY